MLLICLLCFVILFYMYIYIHHCTFVNLPFQLCAAGRSLYTNLQQTKNQQKELYLVPGRMPALRGVAKKKGGGVWILLVKLRCRRGK